MNALIAAAVVWACPDTLPRPQYLVVADIVRGDPLGTREAGTIKVVSRPKLMLTHGQPGWFQVAGKKDPASATFWSVTPWGVAQDRVRVDARFRHLQAQTDGTVNTTLSRHDLTLELGKPVTCRLTAESPTDQTWMVVTVTRARRVEPLESGWPYLGLAPYSEP